MTMTNKYILFLSLLLPVVLLSCSTTKNVPDGDQLFVGLTKIEYQDYEELTDSLKGEQREVREMHRDHFSTTQEEVEAALATAPNGALFGSSYYRTPFPYRLWIWNWAGDSSGKLKKWMKKSFGKPPVLMSQVNPALRASVAQSVLRKNGYMHGKVTYEEVPQRNPKKMKIGYTVSPGPLFVVDTLSYENFPSPMRHLIDSTSAETRITQGTPFSVGNLDGERSRLSQLMRNNGYYYYQPGYASFLADTFAVAEHARLRLQLADSLPEQALRPWYIGNITMQMRRSFREQLTDSTDRSFLKIRYNGKRPPMRPRVVLRNMRLRPRSLFSYDNYQESMQKVNATGVFSSVDFQFRPRPGTDTLDLTLNCVFDQPYDFYVETNFVNRTIGRRGPEVKVGLVRRNAFRGGERLDINLHGAYEWQSGVGSSNNSYQYGIDASVEFPRILFPFVKDGPRRRPQQVGRDSLSTEERTARSRRPRRFYSTPWTIAKVSSDIVRRPNYYKMHIVAGEWTYRWQTSESSQHEFSPLTVKYQFKNSHTHLLDSLLASNMFLAANMSDRFIPKMRYTYIYNSPKNKHNPLRWETSIEEAGNLTSLFFLAKGKRWNEKDKTLFKTAYAQFLRLETDLTKTWTLDQHSQLVGHINAGYLYSYGNTTDAPFSEKFYVGGANSIRAFPVRSIGPGAFPGFTIGGNQFAYVMCNGDLKLVMNLEYRRRLVGNLYGALFLDMGNVWDSTDWTLPVEAENEEEQQIIDEWNDTFGQMGFKPKNLFKDLATGTGIGLRYDLDFLVVRIDWGFGLHVPYKTEKSGYFNIPRFKDMHTLHLAIGYPF
ncbi:MAG: BamA/TamA family outer membrane protein [Prevotella sp.]|nr:BamA/TamA family outer membrane protein [Prevotella sp.]